MLRTILNRPFFVKKANLLKPTLGRECYSWRYLLLGELLWGGNLALGRQSCSGEEILLRGGNLALGRQKLL
ncbi:MAG TPA: hypothetical protein PLB63_01425 [Planctomycetota bacterium]|nr:hypothetical protein [Planctomycetota bacterium]